MKKTKTATALALLALVGLTAAQFAPADASAANAAAKAPRLGVQLWSVKDEIKQDFEGTLTKIAKLGFQGVEFAGEFGTYKDNAAGLKAFMDKNKLACAGAHARFADFAPERFDATVTFYKTLGCSNLVVPMDKRGATPEQSLEMSKELSDISAKLAPLGMRTGYHNHAQEMAGEVGSTPWDVIAQNTPQNAILQQDVGWTTFAGKDPVAYVNKYPGRTVLTHFKAKLPQGVAGTPIIGQDRTDWASLVRAVRKTGGTEWIILEQEEYPNGMGQLETVEASLKGLRKVLASVPAK